jgi:hypothetical protein
MVFIHNGFWRSTLSKTSGGGQKYKSKVSKWCFLLLVSNN